MEPQVGRLYSNMCEATGLGGSGFGIACEYGMEIWNRSLTVPFMI